MGNKLKKYREQQGLTQSEIASKANLSQRSYQNYENGTREPKVRIANRLAKLLNTTVETLFG